MCIRITQHAPATRYVQAVGWTTHTPDTGQASLAPGYNLAPGAHVRILHRLPQGTPHLQRAIWGHALSGKRKPVVDARVEQAQTDPAFGRLWTSGRCIVPIDSWFEWQGEQDRELPFRIHLPDDEPMFAAAIVDIDTDGAPLADGAVVLITAQEGNGLLAAHGQRPVILAAEDARVWMDPATSTEEAHALATELLLPPPAFQWHPVTQEVKDPAFDDPRALEPVQP